MSKLVIERPAPDMVMLVICDADGVHAEVAVHAIVVAEAGLAEILYIMQDAQRRARELGDVGA